MSYQKPKRPFAWSYSRYKNFMTCPKRYYHVDVQKDFAEAESEQLKWGNAVHKAFEEYVRDGAPLPPTMARWEIWAKMYRDAKLAGVNVQVERSLAVTVGLEACDWFAPDTWFRAKIDLSAPLQLPKTMVTVDWKTGGTVNPEFQQLGLSAQAIFAHHADIDTVKSYYIWLGHDTFTEKTYTREDMLGVWNEVLPVIKQMKEAYETLTYPPKPSGLCKRFCPVTSCPYHGKGSY